MATVYQCFYIKVTAEIALLLDYDSSVQICESSR